MIRLAAVLISLGLAAAPALAQAPQPKLLVVVSVDQLSSDLFAEYRQHFTGGLKRLTSGVVFPSGYQSHAATETCPGHSTILTGARPYRTGIIANDWLDQSIAREDKVVYCSEDVTVPGSTSRNYTVSAKHLLVPTLGERMKAVEPASRVVSVSVKDRAAVMMGGHKVDQLWWWNGRDYVTMAGQPAPDPAVTAFRASLAAQLAKPRPAMAMPAACESRNRAVQIGAGKTVGTDRFGREAGNMSRFRASPESDAANLALAGGLIDSMKLGRGAAADIIAIGQSATDYVGHSYGTAGAEMCINLFALDRELGAFFDKLDRSGVDYAIALTADHGAPDLPERSRIQGAADAQRVDARLDVKAAGAQIGRELKLQGPVLLAQGGDLYVERTVPQKRRKAVLRRAIELLRQSPLVEDVLLGADIAALPQPVKPPETWSLSERVRASYMPGRSGDLVLILKQRVNPVTDPTRGYVTTHGSPWDYDRRVPILFWWKGVQPFEQPLGIETVDIMPTLASLIALPITQAEIDGRCLDILAGEPSNCR